MEYLGKWIYRDYNVFKYQICYFAANKCCQLFKLERDNNPFAAAAAFANQKQYWSDFAHIFNSDKLKERRGGLKDDIQAAEIANAARGSKSKAKAVVSYLLKIGYGPTQIADSFAIA